MSRQTSEQWRLFSNEAIRKMGLTKNIPGLQVNAYYYKGAYEVFGPHSHVATIHSQKYVSLISAAPEMLLWLKNALQTIERGLDDRQWLEGTAALTISDIKEVIAKAEGRE